MQFLKISCTRCVQYQACPQKTRMYVNYCGSNLKNIEDKIADATIDCRTRRGLLLAPNLLAFIPVAPGFKEAYAVVSS